MNQGNHYSQWLGINPGNITMIQTNFQAYIMPIIASDSIWSERSNYLRLSKIWEYTRATHYQNEMIYNSEASAFISPIFNN